MSLILASGSPRRRELMTLITPNYTVAPSDVDESRITAATPAQLAQALAEAKALAVAQQHPDDFKDLVVRVAGYSALFNDLERKTQDDIIERTEHEL